SQFFHILHSVEQQKGLCNVGNDEFEYTIYSSCCNVDKGIYYYTTYNNNQITGVNMHHTDLDGDSLSLFTVIDDQQINMVN
ncbi:linear amide C-N hydrolase, partial [Streptococcus suis]